MMAADSDQGIEIPVAIHVAESDSTRCIVMLRNLIRGVDKDTGPVVEKKEILSACSNQDIEIAVAIHVAKRQGHRIRFEHRDLMGAAAEPPRSIVDVEVIRFPGIADERVEIPVAVHVAKRHGTGAALHPRYLVRGNGEDTAAVVEVEAVVTPFGKFASVADQGIEIPVAVHVAESHGATLRQVAGKLARGVDEYPRSIVEEQLILLHVIYYEQIEIVVAIHVAYGHAMRLGCTGRQLVFSRGELPAPVVEEKTVLVAFVADKEIEIAIVVHIAHGQSSGVVVMDRDHQMRIIEELLVLRHRRGGDDGKAAKTEEYPYRNATGSKVNLEHADTP